MKEEKSQTMGVIVATCSIGWIMIGGSQLNIYTGKLLAASCWRWTAMMQNTRIEGRSQTRLSFFYSFTTLNSRKIKKKKKRKKILKKC